MRIAVSTSKGGLEDNVFPVFGRCTTFTIVDAMAKESMKASSIPNPGAGAGGGAGIAAAQAVIGSGVTAIITGNCGPNALAVLSQAGVKTYIGAGNVKNAVNDLLDGKLTEVTSPTKPPNFGMGPGRGKGPGLFGPRGSGRRRGGFQ